MIKMSCRYIDKSGICIKGKMCNNCSDKNTITYTGQYDVFKGVTTVSLSDKGARLISCDIYGQLSDGAIHEYAIDLCKILLQKGVIK